MFDEFVYADICNKEIKCTNNYIYVIYKGNKIIFRVVYLVPMMTMSHIAITTSSFLIVFATVERFCVTVSHQYVEFLQNNRKLIAIFAVFIGVVTKGTLLLEIIPVYDADCADTLNEYRLEVTALVIHNRHYKLWRFWFRNIVTILFPFFTLMYLNARIVNELRKNVYLGTQSNSPNGAVKSISTKQRKARVRAATRTLVLVVSTYLLANMLNVIITIWEHTDATSLFTSFLDFYIISVDAVSLLTIVACASRLPIYASCQTLLRREMLDFAKLIFTKTKPNEATYLLHQKSSTTS
uniref:G-protein coupled receptors family 1 profile domain-containing protein n=2 Tax=Parascaris TaxID=6254 RepID=A0A914RUC5_PAREQ